MFWFALGFMVIAFVSPKGAGAALMGGFGTKACDFRGRVVRIFPSSASVRSDGRRLTRDQGTGGGTRRGGHKGKAKWVCNVRDTSARHISFFGWRIGCPEPLTALAMPPIFLEKGVRNQYEALLDKYDTWLFDCDGVLWNGDQPVDGAKEVLEMLRRQSARGDLIKIHDVWVLTLLWAAQRNRLYS